MRRGLSLILVLLVAFAVTTLLALEGQEVVTLRTTRPEGTPRSTRTWIADADGAAWIEVANPERPFLADIRLHPEVELRRHGTWGPCTATVIAAPEGHLRIRGLLAAKYGWADRWIGQLTDTSGSLALRLACSGAGLFAAHCASCHGAAAEGSGHAPDIRCATRAADAIRKGRDDAMPRLSGLSDAEIASIEADLVARCDQAGRTAPRVYAANCATCHGHDGSGGRDARWIEGPDIRCTTPPDWAHAVEEGQGGMPPFPGLGHAMVEALRLQVRGRDCPPPSS